MAQTSIFWPTSGVGDGASQYTDAQLEAWLRRTFLRSITTEGVHAGHLNELAVTGAASPVAVNTGAALVDGIPYENTASVNQAIATPSVGTTGHRVVLRASWAAQTVRIAEIASADGVAAIPAAVQIAGTTYDITLATLTITTGGVITLTDARSFLHYTTRVNAAMIDDETITPAKIANRTRKFLVSPRAGKNLTDVIALVDTLAIGLTMLDTKDTECMGGFFCPSDLVSLTTIKAVLVGGGIADANLYIRNTANYSLVGEDYSLHSQTVGYTATAIIHALNQEVSSLDLAASPLVAGQYVRLIFERDATNVLDTTNQDVYFLGWIVTYLADS